MVLLVDNYDSFTWNLAHRLGELGAHVRVVRNDAMTVDEVVRAKGVVPMNLPDANHASEEYAAKHRLSVDGVKGGAETALPEFVRRAAAPAGSGTGTGR